jgi:ubiquinone/menaquinone biosynthesis C-methylase UbiE
MLFVTGSAVVRTRSVMSGLKSIHHRFVSRRRAEALARELASRLPDNANILDVGCGDGAVSEIVMRWRPGVRYEGIDVLARPSCAIPCQTFDGTHIPYGERSFEVVQFVDVLHHTSDIEALVREAARVTRRYVLIKDHVSTNRLDFETLRFMDWVGNAPYGVKLTYNFKDARFWAELYERLDLRVVAINQRIRLYPFPFALVFGRGLHFVAMLEKRAR